MNDLMERMRLDGLRKENARAWAEVERLRAQLQYIDENGCRNCAPSRSKVHEDEQGFHRVKDGEREDIKEKSTP